MSTGERIYVQELTEKIEHLESDRQRLIDALAGVHDLKKLRVTYLGRRWWTRKHKIRITFEFENAEHSFIVTLHKLDTFELIFGLQQGISLDEIPKNIERSK